jgi:hypothetical protein
LGVAFSAGAPLPQLVTPQYEVCQIFLQNLVESWLLLIEKAENSSPCIPRGLWFAAVLPRNLCACADDLSFPLRPLGRS